MTLYFNEFNREGMTRLFYVLVILLWVLRPVTSEKTGRESRCQYGKTYLSGEGTFHHPYNVPHSYVDDPLSISIKTETNTRVNPITYRFQPIVP